MRSDAELKKIAEGLSDGRIVSTLGIQINGLRPGSELYEKRYCQVIGVMFPGIASADSDERARMYHEDGGAAIYFEYADKASQVSENGLPVFDSFEWMGDTELRRMWDMFGWESPPARDLVGA